jgi:hypothetical protein
VQVHFNTALNLVQHTYVAGKDIAIQTPRVALAQEQGSQQYRINCNGLSHVAVDSCRALYGLAVLLRVLASLCILVWVLLMLPALSDTWLGPQEVIT